ncbi:MAG TPA: hypothetical protein PKU94_00125 [Candidatus Hydrothermia bacterium]|nr:hypothetical protein [Candidatus Hydrothermae bacterium]MDD3649696.1 hypothetical protein [Candidatus Hydrothermia bacterium]MDD5573227.1 hypothetical protein [Candidatus Hydrothermia bacterium]HOK23610.1 hypothetical protein [Candidatus Hydrothermia bacterium]HOL24340.1 hypothetical protein [Candidatus Hydrothermia bacterium]
MPCAKKPKEAGPDDVEKKILAVLKGASKPMGCADIAKASGIDVHQVMGKLRGMKARGLVESPEKGKYVVSEAGKKFQ